MKVSLSFGALALLWATPAISQTIVEDMSFGHKSPLSPNSFNIPGWSMLGEGHVPQLLSDKVIMTPPYGGNKRGSLWAEKNNNVADWQAELKFRAGGQDRAGGNLQLWYAANGEKGISTSSVYTVGKWDGLAIVVDSIGGIQKVRGFLNDGNTEYKNHQDVSSLAFGHCDYVYRNLGRPSSLKIKSTQSGGLEVTVDDKPCFSSQKITLPSNYGFGMTAASADPPDTFEIFGFTLSSLPAGVTPPSNNQNFVGYSAPPTPNQNPQGMLQADDTPASQYTTTETQFADLHNRLNLLSKSITNLFSEVSRLSSSLEARHNELVNRIPANNAAPNTNSQSNTALDNRLANLERILTSMEKELKSGDHSGQFAKISEQIQQTHVGVTEHVPARMREYVIAHTPRIGFILYSFMAFQTLCVGGFVWYKWRKNTMPKKYL
jgi:lectin, mannose-binding 1